MMTPMTIGAAAPIYPLPCGHTNWVDNKLDEYMHCSEYGIFCRTHADVGVRRAAARCCATSGGDGRRRFGTCRGAVEPTEIAVLSDNDQSLSGCHPSYHVPVALRPSSAHSTLWTRRHRAVAERGHTALPTAFGRACKWNTFVTPLVGLTDLTNPIKCSKPVLAN